MRQKLKNIDWNEIFKDETDVDILWSKIEHEIIKARDEFIPKKVIKKKTLNYKYKPPVPQTLLELYHKKRNAFKY